MKKLLSLLSILTINISALPTVIAITPNNQHKNLKQTKKDNIQTLEQQNIVIKANNGIRSSGVVFNNKLYFGSEDKNVYEYNPVTNQQKIVITTTRSQIWPLSVVFSSGVVFNNKLYFGSHDSNVYEYDPITKQQKTVIKTNDVVYSSGVVLNNKLYFGSFDHNVYEYDPITKQQKTVIKTNDVVYSSGVVLNNKLYFGSFDHNVYEYDPITNQQNIVIKANNGIRSSGVVFNNKLYFGSEDKNVYEYNPVTNQQKIVITTTRSQIWPLSVVFSSGVVFNNKLYFGSHDSNVYEYDPITKQQKTVIKTNDVVYSSGVVLNNKLYFGSFDHNVYEYDPITKQQKTVIKTNDVVYSSGVVLNNKLYFGSFDHNVYEYDPITNQQKIVITTNDAVYSSGVVFNNKLYFGSWDHNVYEYSVLYNLESFIQKRRLNKINNNNDKSLLNEINYLNPELDISQLEIKEKDDISAIIKSKENNNKYFGEKKIYYKIDNQQNKIIDLNEVIKKAIFFKFHDNNTNLKFKEIKNINTDDLIYSNITATKSIEPIYSKNNKSICFGTTTLFHNLSEVKTMKSPSCKYTKETTVNNQITTGLSKTNSAEKSTEQSSSSNTEHNWNFELGTSISGEAGFWPFGKVTTTVETKIGTGGSYGSSSSTTSSETKTLSNTFDLSNSKSQEQKTTYEVELPSQDITINPNQKIKITASLDEVLAQVTLNLKQDIYGEINAKVMTSNNEEKNITLSIKEAMQILQKYSLLPDEITINEDNGITFNGKADKSLKQGFDASIEFREIKN